ncbi:Eco57I restriction-modification methylase domain-containing protein [Pedobacter terrae]|uniref:Eco57I restriction-modification methylase domain-containing protein n=1 Tax=Pedobacter terrae TaxID=405671 RepID=UPI002FF9C3BA
MPANHLQIKKALQYPYDRILFAKEVLSPVFGSGLNLFKDLIPSGENLSLSESKVIDKVNMYGTIKLEDDTEITCYEIKLQSSVRIERSKVVIQKYVRKLLTSGQAALVNFITPNDNTLWRLTLVAKDSIISDDGIVERLTHAKRYTYLVGPAENCTTVAERLEALSIEKQIDFTSLVNAFSVEKLNKAFYNDISEQFYKLIGATIGKGKTIKTYERVLQLPSVSSDTSKPYQEFAVRLIGRTVFCWFLKVKKSDAGISLLPEHLLSSKAVRQNPSYYHNILEKLFFQTLNTPTCERITDLPNGCEYIPFLNGGLFEAQYDDYYKLNAATGYSSYINNLIIPDQWFVDFFEKLEQYNFTIDENSILDVEVSVDPEMLGSIFENLLAEIDPDSGETARKATGSFYTPREIVDYMATESLLFYLVAKTEIQRERLEPIFDIEGEMNLLEEEQENVLIALDELKILDPACGSGAFPMGILQKMVFGLHKLDSNADWWIQRQINKTNDFKQKDRVKQKLTNNPDYARKIGIIQNSLYGVDIQPIAAEISKLRCFLTLIVDEHIDENKPNRGIEPLPNLEFKFVTADTLVKLPDETTQVPMYNSKKKKNPLELLSEIQQVRFDYLQSVGDEKQILKERFHEIQKEIFDQQGLFGSVENNRAFKIANWKPFSHEKTDWFDPEWMFGIEKFDIIIGNPPYINIANLQPTEYRNYLKSVFKCSKNKVDTYAFFIERAFDLVKKRGTLCYIIPQTWKATDSFSKLRDLIFSAGKLEKIVDLKMGIFAAIVKPMIILLNCEPYQSYNIGVYDELFHEVMKLNVNDIIYDPLKQINTHIKSSQAYLFRKIELGTNPLSDIIKFSRGVKTSDDSRFLSATSSSNDHKKIFRGRNIKAYELNWNNEYVWYRPDLMKEKVGSVSYTKDFFEVPEKIVTQRINSSMQLLCAYDNQQNYFLDTTNVSRFDDWDKQTPLKYLCALLNSKVINFWYSNKYLMPTIGIYELHSVPIKKADINTQNHIIRLVDEILSFKQTGESDKVLLNEEKINAIVYHLYELSYEDALIIDPQLDINKYELPL